MLDHRQLAGSRQIKSIFPFEPPPHRGHGQRTAGPGVREGGATETVVEGETGTFFAEQSGDVLIDGLDRIEAMRFDPAAIAAHAGAFSADRFAAAMRPFVNTSLAQHAA